MKEDRLGQQLARISHEPVWSISAGSWALRNELTYLRLHSEVVNSADKIIFILNSGDFGDASSWSCEYTHPRSYPLFASLYLFKRYIYLPNTDCNGIPPKELLVPSGNWKYEFSKEFLKPESKNKEIIIFLYPTKNELANNKLEYLETMGEEIIKIRHHHLAVYSLGRDSRWSVDLYKDAIHPSVAGMQELAKIIYKPNYNTRLEK